MYVSNSPMWLIISVICTVQASFRFFESRNVLKVLRCDKLLPHRLTFGFSRKVTQLPVCVTTHFRKWKGRVKNLWNPHLIVIQMFPQKCDLLTLPLIIFWRYFRCMRLFFFVSSVFSSIKFFWDFFHCDLFAVEEICFEIVISWPR